MKAFDYVMPESFAQATSYLVPSRGSVHAKSGGTDLVARLREGIDEATRLVNLLAIRESAAIEITDDELAIGALATLAELASHPDVLSRWTALAEAAGAAATPQVRNVATVGGNLCQRPRCWYYRQPHYTCLKKGGDACLAVEGDNRYHAILGEGPCVAIHPSNLAPALVVLGASVVAVGPADASRAIAIEDFFAPSDGDPTVENVLGPQELVRQVLVPAASGRSAFLEVRERQSFDWPLVTAAGLGRVGPAGIVEIRLSLGAVANRPWRLTDCETFLLGETPSAEVFEEAARLATTQARPLSGNAYKLPLVQTLVTRVLERIFTG